MLCVPLFHREICLQNREFCKVHPALIANCYFLSGKLQHWVVSEPFLCLGGLAADQVLLLQHTHILKEVKMGCSLIGDTNSLCIEINENYHWLHWIRPFEFGTTFTCHHTDTILVWQISREGSTVGKGQSFIWNLDHRKPFCSPLVMEFAVPPCVFVCVHVANQLLTK